MAKYRDGPQQRMPNAYTLAVTKPATMNPARYMCTSSCQKYEFSKSAAKGWMSTASPFSSRKPVGWFIQPLTAITINEPVKPVITIGMPARKCAFGDRRSQP